MHNIGRVADTWTLKPHPDTPHAVCELLVHAEHISLANSLAGWRLVQDLVLGTAEGVSQPSDVLFRHMQPFLDLAEAELLICRISQSLVGTAKDTTDATQKEPAGTADCHAPTIGTQGQLGDISAGTQARDVCWFYARIMMLVVCEGKQLVQIKGDCTRQCSSLSC